MKNIKLVDLKSQQERIRPGLDRRMSEVLQRGDFIMGKEVQEFEQKVCEYSGAAHCVTCANGTDALQLALMAYGVGPGDIVLVPSFTFIASAEVVSLLGATPLFVDVELGTFNLCPQSLRRRIKSIQSSKSDLNLRGIIAAELFGLPAKHSELSEIAEEFGLFLISDSAQSFGAKIGEKRVGSHCEMTTLSFFPTKTLACYGDGGAVLCSDAELAARMHSIRLHGRAEHKYDNVRIGMNSRLDTLQAAILLEKFSLLDEEIEKRQSIADRYCSELSDVLVTPQVPIDFHSAWCLFTVQVEGRNELAGFLKDKGIQSGIYYPKALHQQAAFTESQSRLVDTFGASCGTCPNSEKLANSVLSIPAHAYLSEEQQGYVIASIKERLS